VSVGDRGVLSLSEPNLRECSTRHIEKSPTPRRELVESRLTRARDASDPPSGYNPFFDNRQLKQTSINRIEQVIFLFVHEGRKTSLQEKERNDVSSKN
jgi:hypothetical protein